MRRLTAMIAATLVVLVALSTSVPAAAAAGSRPARTVTLQRWVRSVCGGLLDWGDHIDTANTKVQKALTGLESGKRSAKKARTKLLGLLSDVTKATDRLIAKVKRLGTPRATNGASVATSFTDTLSDVRSSFTNARRSLTRLKPDDRKASREKVTSIEEQLENDIADIGDPLEDPRADQEFAAALNNEPTCTDLLPQFTPTAFVPGDCLDADSPDVSLEDFEAVSCTEPHFEEVFAVAHHPAGPSDPFPGESSINTFAESTCTNEFRTYTGADIESSRFVFSYFTPDKDTWPLGDREVVCLAEKEDGSRRNGSVKESAAN